MGDRRFDDDFTTRLKKQMSNKFRKNVKPLELLPHLKCIEEEDEEFIRAQHNNLGDIKTADILLNLLVTKENWQYDLIEALRHKDVGCGFLAVEFEDNIRTVPAIFNIVSKSTMVASESPVESYVAQEVSDKDHERKIKRRNDELELRRKEIEISIMEHSMNGIRGPSDMPTVFANLKDLNPIFKESDNDSLMLEFRIQSFQQLMQLEDLWRSGALKKLFDKDILTHGQIKDIEKGAQIKGHPVHNITSDLIIRQADTERCKAWLKHTNTNHLAHFDVVDCLSVALWIQSIDSTTAANKQAIIRYTELRLPACLTAMIEDPFLQKRVQDFYELPALHDKMRTELSDEVTNETKSVAELFLVWFHDEITHYGTKLGHTILNKLIQIAALFHILIKNNNTSFIPEIIDPNEVWSEYKEIVDEKVYFKILSAMPVVWNPGILNGLLSYVDVPQIVYVEVESIADICQILAEKGILYRFQNGFKFVSTLLRDVFLSRFISVQDVIQPEFDCGKYPFLLQVFGFEEPYKKVSVFHEQIHVVHNDARFAVVKFIRHLPDRIKTVFYKGKNDFYIPDMINVNEWTGVEMSILKNAQRQIDMKCSAGFSVADFDLSVAAFGEADDVELLHAFHLINVYDSLTANRRMVILKDKFKVSIQDRCFSNQELHELKNVHTPVLPEVKRASSGELELDKGHDKMKVQSLNMSGQTPRQTGMQNLTRLLAVTPTLRKLILQACKLTPGMLTENLKSGNFEQVTHLDISNNPGIGYSFQVPLGLMFLPNLVTLEIQYCGLEDKGMEVLADELKYVYKLRQLNVSYNSMTAKGLLELSTGLSDCTGLTHLRLQKNNLGYFGSIILANWLKKLVLLEVLNVSDCNIDDNGIALITQSMKSKAVLRLSMRNNHFRKHPVFVNTMKVTLLNHFDYSENPLYDSGNPLKARLLNHLDYSENPVNGSNDRLKVSEEVEDGDLDRKHLQKIGANEVKQQDAFEQFLQGPFKWYHLSFWKCSLGYRRVFQTVEKYQSLTNLSHLCLQENHITDDFVNDLSACLKQFCKVLSHLNLRQNQINDTGIETLASALKDHKFLAEIFLDRNSFSDEGAGDMVNCCLTLPSLTILDMSCNYISKGVVSETVKMFKATLTAENETNAFIVRKKGDTTCVEGYM